MRNKTIAALSDFVLIIECTVPSGTLTTVQAAATYGVDVGATPGPIGSPLSQGPHQIISLGAQCITHPLDVVAQFGPLLQRPKPSKHNPIK